MVEIDEERIKEIIPQVLGKYSNSNTKEGRLVSLVDLIKDVYTTYGFNESEIDFLIDKDAVNFKRDFLMKINGCYSEARVGRLFVDDTSKVFDSTNIPDDWSKIKIDCGSYDNPLLFIIGDKPVDVPKFDLSDDGKETFLVFSDLHLEEKLIDDNGNFIVRSDGVSGKEILNQRIDMFFETQKKVIQSLKSRGQNISGIIFTGDILDVNSKYVINKKASEKYVDLVVERIRERKALMNANNPDEVLPEFDFVVGILGNHEGNLGENFDECRERMNDVMKELFGSNAVILGSGAARVRVSDSFLSIQHSVSNDFVDVSTNGTFVTKAVKTRDLEFASVSLFDEYISLCQNIYNKLVMDGKTVVLEGGSSGNTVNLFNYVNTKLAKENPALYNFYAPFIECDRNYVSSNVGDKPRDGSFFETHLSLNAGSLEKSNYKYKFENDPKPEHVRSNLGGYHRVFLSNDFLKDVLLGQNPFYVREDFSMPAVTFLGHNHERLDEVVVKDDTNYKNDSGNQLEVAITATRAYEVGNASDCEKAEVHAVSEEAKGREYFFERNNPSGSDTKMNVTISTIEITDKLIRKVGFENFSLIFKGSNLLGELDDRYRIQDSLDASFEARGRR